MYENKNILILGFGVTGKSALKCLSKWNTNIYIYDEKEDLLKDYSGEIFKIFKEENLGIIDFIVKSPGINPNHKLLKLAREKGIPIKSDLELFYEISKCKNTIAITGTNGKTTTTSLLANILKEIRKTYCVGNIGKSVLDAASETGKDDYVVIEASSFQLEDTLNFKPHISIVTNITSDHLDWHGTTENYKLAKYKIFANQDENDFIIFNESNNELKSKKIRAKKYKFSTKGEVDRGAYVSKGDIYFKDSQKEKIMSVKDIKIPGDHNLENILCAISAAKLLNVDSEIIKKSVSNFMGVEHRIEYVREIKGVKYYNDSKGTNPDSTIMAIKAIDKNIVLIAGGYDKNADFDEMLKVGEGKIKHLVLFGQTAEKLQKSAKKLNYDIYLVNNLEKAVKLSYTLAQVGDTVLLSPACASWDMYPSYEVRGEDFKKLVNELV